MFQIIKTKNMGFFLFVISLFKSYMSKQYYSKLKKKSICGLGCEGIWNQDSKQDHEDV